MATIKRPEITKVSFDLKGVSELQNNEMPNELLLDFPTVYIIRSKAKKGVTVYIGETTDIVQRTLQHLNNDPKKHHKWKKLIRQNSESSEMVVIGHEHFNKSMTLDIENRLIEYMLGTPSVSLMNGRGNPQTKYFPKHERNKIFARVWDYLHKYDPSVFPLESAIKDSALFKASPLKELTPSQEDARKSILLTISSVLRNKDKGRLILVEGEAGSGKTVLLSRIFYEVMTTMNNSGETSDTLEPEGKLDGYLLVNHDEQVKIYQQVMEKLGISTRKDSRVSKPTNFINSHDPESPVDVVLVDESHLLWTQGKQAYQGKNQLQDLLERARTVIAVFDPRQILSGNEYLTNKQIERLQSKARNTGGLIYLKQQLRVQAGKETINWLENLTSRGRINPLPKNDPEDYELKIFDSATAMYAAIKKKAEDENHGISRMLATFDWPFIQKSKPKDSDYWMVTTADGLRLPWNKQLPVENIDSYVKTSQLSWAEQPQSIKEVGSTFTIQGSDLNYAGVILGPSVKYRNGRIIHDAAASANKNVRNKRTLEDGTKADVSKELLENEMNVLLSRGVHGLYIYAVDKALRDQLLKAQQNADKNRNKTFPVVAEEQINLD